MSLESPHVKLCECGCGNPAPISPRTSTEQGYTKGRPRRFVQGHNQSHYPMASLEERFWARVRKTESCWVWKGATCGPSGYGRIARGRRGEFHKKNSALVHRLSWELHNGPIPEGLLVLHRCDNPPCIRPDHLFLGTAKDNSDDKCAKGRQHIPRPRTFPTIW